MEHQLSLHLKNFNKKVQVLNQTNSKELVLSAVEARNLQAEIFELLAHITDMTATKDQQQADAVISIEMNGGTF